MVQDNEKLSEASRHLSRLNCLNAVYAIYLEKTILTNYRETEVFRKLLYEEPSRVLSNMILASLGRKETSSRIKCLIRERRSSEGAILSKGHWPLGHATVDSNSFLILFY